MNFKLDNKYLLNCDMLYLFAFFFPENLPIRKTMPPKWFAENQDMHLFNSALVVDDFFFFDFANFF